MHKKSVFFLLIQLFIFTNSVGLFALNPRVPVQQNMQTVWTSRNGLPSDNITRIFQDSKGYMWIGTFNGLVRFDGVQFEEYSRKTREDFQANSANVFLEDTNGVLWVGTNGDGLACLQDDSFKMIPLGQDFPHTIVRSLAITTGGAIFVGTSQGLVKLDENRIAAPFFPDIFKKTNISCLYLDQNDYLWVSSGFGELYQVTGTNYDEIQKINILPGMQVMCIYEDRKGRQWFGTQNNGIFIRTGGVLKKAEGVFTGKTVNVISPGSNDDIWIGTDSGLFRHYEDKFSVFNQASGLHDDQVSTIVEDREGNLWMGTSRGGVTKLSTSKFQVISKEKGLVDFKVNCVREDVSGRFWIGTDRGVHLYNKGFQNHPVVEKTKGIRVRHIQQNENGELWISTYSDMGVLVWDGISFSHWTEKKGLTGNRCRMTLQDRSGFIWVATTNGLNRISPEGMVTTFSRENGLTEDYILCVYESSQGEIWVGTNGSGLYRWENGKLVHVDLEAGLPSGVIFRVYEDTRGNLWVSSSEGLSLYKDGKFIHYSVENGLLGHAVFQIIDDHQDHYWMTADIGVFRAPVEEMLKIENGKAPFVEMELFNSIDGLPAAPTPVSWAIQTEQGEIWFPTLDGVAILDPGEIPVNSKSPPVYVKSIQVDSTLYSVKNFSTLNPGYKRITLNFTGLSYVVPEEVLFQYRLVGFDPKWSPLGHSRKATYTTLPPGDYKFQVRALNNDKVWSDEPAEVVFRQPATFIQTSWFYLVIILTAGALFGIVLGMRNYRLRQQRAKLRKMVETRTKEIQSKNMILQLQKEELEKVHAQVKKANQRLEYLAKTDPLTQIANRRHFVEHLQTEWKRCIRAGATISLIMIDVDYFKNYNDTYGHQAGDSCLQNISRVFTESVFRPSDLVARFGGEEFIAVLPETDKEAAEHIAQRVLVNVQELKMRHSASSAGSIVTVSIGVATIHPHLKTDPEELVRMADKALYQSKNTGRNCVTVYHS